MTYSDLLDRALTIDTSLIRFKRVSDNYSMQSISIHGRQNSALPHCTFRMRCCAAHVDWKIRSFRKRFH